MRHLRRLSVTLAALAMSLGLLLGAGAQAEELVKYQIVGGERIDESLTGQAGDPENGRQLAIDRKQSNCLACHVLPIPEQPFHGDVGPDLTGVGGDLSEGEVRLRIVNPKVVNPDTIMPAFYRNDGFERVLKKFQGKTMVSAQQVEDVADSLFNPDPYYQQGGDVVRVGGMAHVIDIAKPIGQRISEMTLIRSGQPIEAGKSYVVSGWASVAEGPLVYDVLTQYLGRHRVVDIPENQTVKIVNS